MSRDKTSAQNSLRCFAFQIDWDQTMLQDIGIVQAVYQCCLLQSYIHDRGKRYHCLTLFPCCNLLFFFPSDLQFCLSLLCACPSSSHGGCGWGRREKGMEWTETRD
uniref:Uncharacterized protein n=1 Tax=Aegilops tauschii subsp. strangulata TaxID=200361 RepID=A0A453JRJ8_AEGTS